MPDGEKSVSNVCMVYEYDFIWFDCMTLMNKTIVMENISLGYVWPQMDTTG